MQAKLFLIRFKVYIFRKNRFLLLDGFRNTMNRDSADKLYENISLEVI